MIMWRSPLKDINSIVKLSLLFVPALLLLHHILFYYSPRVANSTLVDVQENEDQPTTQEKCDLFVGDWVDDEGEGEASYKSSCRFIVDHQNCMKNGRPDSDYLKWRWRPRPCHLPRLDPLKFLQLMRNKSWAFVGDSISRNHIESLLCLLSKGYKSFRWHFPTYNLTTSLIWSPFLAKSFVPESPIDASPSQIDLYLDTLDPSWTQHYNNWDYIILSTGSWYSKTAIYYENNTAVGCHNCPKRNLTEMGLDHVFRRVMKMVLEYIVTSNHEGWVFYRTNSPSHFEGGEWYEGGSCNRTEPVKEGVLELNFVDKVIRDVELEEFEKAYVRAWEKEVKLRLFDVNPMSLLRPDGHPGVYRFMKGKNNNNNNNNNNGTVIGDCLHWCLPGWSY